MLKRCCCAWQIWNKQHLRRRVEFKWASRNPGAGILSCRWRHRGGGVKPHFLFMRFHGLLLVVPELSVCSSVRACVCRCVCRCVCVRESYKQSTWGQTHTHVLYSVNTISLHTGKRKQEHACECMRCKCVWLHTHIHEIKWCPCRGLKQVWGGVSSTVYNPPPTMYVPFVFCDRRRRRKTSI